MGPGEPHEPHDEGARRPSEDDDTFGFNDPAFDNDGGFSRRRRAYSNGPGFNPDAGFSPDAGYATEQGEYEAPVFTEEELEGLGPEGGTGPRRVLPREDEPTTLVARYLFPTERYRGEWKRHWIHLSTPLLVGTGVTFLLGYLSGYLTRQNIGGLTTAAVLLWFGVMGWVGWEVADW